MYHIDEPAVKATTRFYAEYMDQIASQRYKDFFLKPPLIKKTPANRSQLLIYFSLNENIFYFFHKF